MGNQIVTETAAEKIRDVADDVLQGADDAVKKTKKVAGKAFDEAQEKIDSLRNETEPAIDDLAVRAQELASLGLEFCSETSARARRQMHQAAEATQRYVSDQPAKSMALAVASGAALAALVMWMSKRRNH